MSPEPIAKFDPKWCPNTFLLFATLEKALFGREHSDVKEYSKRLRQDSISILNAIGAVDIDGGMRYGVDNFISAWNKNHLDWFHQQFMRLPGYYDTIMAVKQRDIDSLYGKCGYLNLARKLGQVARLDPASFIILGDKVCEDTTIVALLANLLPNIGDKITIYNLCHHMGSLGITPYRLECALKKCIRNLSYEFPFEVKALGIRQPGYEETVVQLKSSSFDFEPISSGKFKMGSLLSYSELVRTI